MPADYHSTARALAVPPSPDEPLSPPLGGIRPPWSRSAGSRRSSAVFSAREVATLRDRIINQTEASWRRISKTFARMTLLQKVGAVSAAIAAIALGLAFMIFTGKIFHWLAPVAESWENSKLAYCILWICIFGVSFPPLVGWSTFGTVSGFIFGIWKGWLLYASATVVGSTCSFIVSRTILSRFVKRLMEHDKRFTALALTLKYDGLKLLCMIRLCPLPYSICNGAVSTFPTVHPLMYGLATAIVTPKLLVPAFIGSRLRVLSEKDEQMSALSKAVNITSIIITVGIGIFTGWYIYRRTLARAKELEAEERANIRQSDHAAHRPHRPFSDDPEANGGATTPSRDEEEDIGFYDDVDDDNVDLVVDDVDSDGASKQSRVEGTLPKGSNGAYRDEFTDNDSDIFEDGNGDNNEVYGLHKHIRTGSSESAISK
ncbi:hypothetical protein M432DRAFT_123707 [Thermoascus aurantiacus ATCC 26904]